MSSLYCFPDDGLPVQISFSGGRTSGYMLRRLMDANPDFHDRARVVFANTGREMPETLDFVAEVDRRWGVGIVWVEWRDGEHGHRFEVVGRQGASENGEPFEALICKKRYLPNRRVRFCTSELKVRTARDYLRSIGWEHWTAAIGIRADEPHRIENKPDLKERWKRWLPLAEAGITKRDVIAFWKAQPFDLRLQNVKGKTPYGNCDGCFLKSEAFLARLSVEHPERHAWWERMEEVAAGMTSGSGATFSKRHLRRELREAMERQGEFLLTAEGALCQADDGECME